MKIDHASLIGIFEQKREQVRKFNLMDDDFFTVVMQDKGAFEVMLRILTGRDDLHVTEVRTQYTMRNLVGHSVILPANAEATANDDGTLSIVLTDASGNVLDTYIIAPETGIGKDSSGAEVNLPQTGNNSMGTLMTASGAVLLVFAGIFVMMKSGVIRRRKEEE